MPDQVQLRGGSKEENDGFVGAHREITVDTSSHTLRVHDGSTTGGHPLASGTSSTDPEPDTLIQRDAWGRAQVTDPVGDDDIANKRWVAERITDAGTPAGTVQTFAMASAPDGWLKADGATVSRDAYEALFEAIGTTYGEGDGTTTFDLPDLRGEFPRGWDDGRGVDSGRVLGSPQSASFASHSHTQNYLNRVRRFQADGNATATVPLSGESVAGDWGSSSNNAVHYRNGTAPTSSDGGAETRPRNVALLYCIKY